MPLASGRETQENRDYSPEKWLDRVNPDKMPLLRAKNGYPDRQILGTDSSEREASGMDNCTKKRVLKGAAPGAQ